MRTPRCCCPLQNTPIVPVMRWRTLLISLDFKRENISEHSTLMVVARRRQILHSATALNKGYFDWHKHPQIEFVGEMADYGGPTRKLFSQSGNMQAIHFHGDWKSKLYLKVQNK
ncbi:hypothetical protein SRHO_G00319640 [Serrasalmus rhombeus]